MAKETTDPTKVLLPDDNCVCKSCNNGIWFTVEGRDEAKCYCKEMFMMTFSTLITTHCQAWQPIEMRNGKKT